MKVAIIMGSDSDLKVMQAAIDLLKNFNIMFEVTIASAHRTPEKLHNFVKNSDAKIFIAAAGMAAHLAGVIASLTTKPVIGVPIASGSFQGFDSLLSTVQMPSGIPVATVAVNGAKNAAFLAIEILALNDPTIAQKLLENRKQQVMDIELKDSTLKETLL